MEAKENKIETPKLECPGCMSRDRIIESLAREIDRQSSEIKLPNIEIVPNEREAAA